MAMWQQGIKNMRKTNIAVRHYQRAAQLIAAITRMSVEQRTITVG